MVTAPGTPSHSSANTWMLISKSKEKVTKSSTNGAPLLQVINHLLNLDHFPNNQKNTHPEILKTQCTNTRVPKKSLQFLLFQPVVPTLTTINASNSNPKKMPPPKPQLNNHKTKSKTFLENEFLQITPQNPQTPKPRLKKNAIFNLPNTSNKQSLYRKS